jgi:hypothetical protein
MSKWKNRKELPALIKLDLKFDIEKLKADIKTIENQKWNACISGELEVLRQKWGEKLSDVAYGKSNSEIDMLGKQYDTLGYQQLSLTHFNPEYEIRSDRQSGTIWDKQYLGGKKELDQRAYNKLHENMPQYLNSILQSLGPNLTRVGLARLLPGEEIKPHRDFDPTFSCRFHIAIETNEKAVFNGIHIPADGYVWFANTGALHWVKNEGSTPRTHLIFNMDSQELLDAYWKI